LKLGEEVDMAIVGLDSLWRHRSLVQVENLSEDDLQILENKKAVGQTCFRFYDIWGNICDENLNKRVIGISLNELKKIDTVVGIATSLDTIEAIIGGLRSGFLDVLISDEKTVEEIIVHEEDSINNNTNKMF
jgi:DNA-binding transcriptional regulator LsrR (DeoR family)